MFVTLKVFKLIGPSNDGRRHGRGTYLFFVKRINTVRWELELFPWGSGTEFIKQISGLYPDFITCDKSVPSRIFLIACKIDESLGNNQKYPPRSVINKENNS
jgi:hypothetical protein